MAEYREFDFDPRTLPKEYAAAIGRVVAANAHTEAAIEDAIAGILGINSLEGWALTTHINVPTREDILKSLAEFKFADHEAKKELRNRLAAIKSSTKIRNDLVHCQWVREKATGKVGYIKITSRGQLQGEFREISVDALLRHADVIYKAGMALQSFLVIWNVRPLDI